MRPCSSPITQVPFARTDLQADRERHAYGAPADVKPWRFARGVVANRGEAVEPGEREVSVLFSDLRGYATFAEHRRPQEVFRAVHRYAQVVSGVVHDYGGVIVDFCGDGMMAVFGALEVVPCKERAALATAREICAQIAADPPLKAGPESTLSVGVGVATGDAYVGEIHAADRTFWSAVGSTTNLAARLQHLTRELACALAIDSRTCQRAGELAAGLMRHSGVAIRGLMSREDVYILPVGPSGDPRMSAD